MYELLVEARFQRVKLKRVEKKSAYCSLRKSCPYSEFFWSVFSRIQTEHRPEKRRTRKLFTQLLGNLSSEFISFE